MPTLYEVQTRFLAPDNLPILSNGDDSSYIVMNENQTDEVKLMEGAEKLIALGIRRGYIFQNPGERMRLLEPNSSRRGIDIVVATADDVIAKGRRTNCLMIYETTATENGEVVILPEPEFMEEEDFLAVGEPLGKEKGEYKLQVKKIYMYGPNDGDIKNMPKEPELSLV